MIRFMTFVDGSNLDGALKYLNIRVDNYSEFYRYIFNKCAKNWADSLANESPRPSMQHSRIYWFVVGNMDEWDFSDPKSSSFFRNRFEQNDRAFRFYLEEAKRRNPKSNAEQIRDQAWNICFSEVKEWYAGKKRSLEKRKRFYYGVQVATDFLEMRESGHWKVDLLDRQISEKGLDTSLAVDMVGLKDTYDVCILISGDADGIPGINYVKDHSKHVIAVEFRRGGLNERAKGSSGRLKIAADSVVVIYENDLISENLAYRSEGEHVRSSSDDQ